MLKKVLAGVGVVLLILVAVVASRPSEFSVERSATIDAPASVVFGIVNDFHNWDAWSPWSAIDPNMEKTFQGAASGVGSIYEWKGNKEVGSGRMTLTDSRPSESIGMKLEFFEPWQATHHVEFTFQPAEGQADKTVTTWKMHGTNNFVSKFFCMFMDMDKMVGADFEKGLASLNTIAAKQAQEEAAAAAAAAAAVPPVEGAAPTPEAAPAPAQPAAK